LDKRRTQGRINPLTKVFGRVKSKLEETKIWLKRKKKRKSAVAVANEILEIKGKEIKNQESLPDFLVRMIELESTLKTELPKEVKVEKRRSLFDYQASILWKRVEEINLFDIKY